MEEPGLTSMEAMENGGLRMTFAPGPFIQHFAVEMRKCLKENKGINYVEFRMIDQETGEEWALLLQRSEGLSPAEKATRAEQRYDRLNTHHEAVKKQIMAALGNGSDEGLWKPGTTWYDAAAEAIGRLVHSRELSRRKV